MVTHIDKDKFIKLFYVDRLSYQEIANLLGCSTHGLINIRQRNKLPVRGWAHGHPMQGKTHPAWNRGIKGKDNPLWRGGRTKSSQGYVLIYMPQHPSLKSGERYIFEHRLIMENFLNRFLTRDEQVHHVNGDKSDNRIENLEVLTRPQHASLHFPKGFNFGVNHNLGATKVKSVL